MNIIKILKIIRNFQVCTHTKTVYNNSNIRINAKYQIYQSLTTPFFPNTRTGGTLLTRIIFKKDGRSHALESIQQNINVVTYSNRQQNLQNCALLCASVMHSFQPRSATSNNQYQYCFYENYILFTKSRDHSLCTGSVADE